MNFKAIISTILDKSFYQQEDVVLLSQLLLGKYLVTNFGESRTVGKIVETEAYRAPDDKACHAYNNLRTKRTETMFGPGGMAYVYLCYGIHHLFNVVTGPPEKAMAVLIRAVEPIEGVEHMLKRRNKDQVKPQLTAGPGVMSQALGITTHHNNSCLFSGDSNMWIEDRGQQLAESKIIASPRVGVAYAEECAEWPWRFRIKDNPWTSKAR